MLTKEIMETINFNEIFFTVCGPGEFPEDGLCSGTWKVTEKCENRFGYFCRLENTKTHEIDTMHGISTVGIGWYRAKDCK